MAERDTRYRQRAEGFDPRSSRRERQLARKARVRRQRVLVALVVLVVLLAAAATTVVLGISKSPLKIPAPKKQARITRPTFREATTAPATPADYTIKFDVSETPGAQVDPAQLTVALGSMPPKLPYAFLENKRFTGWYTGPADDEEAACIDNSMLSLIPTSTSTILYARFESAPEDVDHDVRGLPVLMYHDFYDPDAGETATSGGSLAGNCLSVKTFNKQLAWLRDHDYYFPDWTEVLDFVQGRILLPEKSVVLTSDDALPNFFKLAVPAAEANQVPITSFVIGANSDPALIKSIDTPWVDFESHSFDLHVGNADGDGLITTASEDKIIADIEKETQVIGPHAVFCYPFGRAGRDYSKRVEKILSENGYDLAFTVSPGRVYPGMNTMALPRSRVLAPCSMAEFQILVD